MAKRFIRISVFILALLLCMQFAYSQDVILECGSLELDRNIRTFRIPVDISNNSHIGGMTLAITTDEIDPPYILKPIGIDRSGGRIANWEYFNYSYSDEDSTRIRMVGLADLPGGGDIPPLPPGEGLLLEVIFTFGCDYTVNTDITVIADTANFSDTTGYILFEIDLQNGCINVGDDTSLRGDANCDGLVIGSDITYLISYLDNLVGCSCSLRAGDANADGEVNIADVVYLIRYFDGEGPPPGN
ncbi:MAG: hypothetical protein GY839_13435 [candidate division Zixibacteria bacterium]|nr:hypothetical protein [candidate division Zixibacteria bacterium]